MLSVDRESQEAGDDTPRQQSANVNACRASTEEPAVERLGTLSRESSTRPLPKQFHLAAKPGLAPSAALDWFGFEPVDMVCTTDRSIFLLSYSLHCRRLR